MPLFIMVGRALGLFGGIGGVRGAVIDGG